MTDPIDNAIIDIISKYNPADKTTIGMDNSKIISVQTITIETSNSPLFRKKPWWMFWRKE